MIIPTNPSRLNHSGKVLPIVLISLAVIFGVIFGNAIGEKTTGLVAGFVRDLNKPQKFEESAWDKRELLDLTLEAPFAFTEGSDLTSELPQDVKKALLSQKTMVANVHSKNFRSIVTLMEYKEGIPLSLDGAVKQVAQTLGEKEPQFTVTPSTLDGLPARKLSYVSESTSKGPVKFEALIIQKEQRLYLVQVIYSHDNNKDDALRLTNSVHVKSE